MNKTLWILVSSAVVAIAAFLFAANNFKGLRLEMPPLHDAAQAGNVAKVKQLLAEGYGPDTTDENGTTALWYALHSEHYDIANMLLAAGANVNSKDKYGRSLLSYARSMGSAGYLSEGEQEACRKAEEWLTSHGAR